MRYSLILASLAVTALTAPVPVAKNEIVARRQLADNAVESYMTKRYQRTNNGDLIGSRSDSDHFDAEKRILKFVDDASSKREQSKIEERDLRYGNNKNRDLRYGNNKARSEDEEEVEKRTSRFPAYFSGGEEKRTSRFPAYSAGGEEKREGVEYGNKARSEEDKSEIEVEERDLSYNNNNNNNNNKARSEEEDVADAAKNTVRNIYDGVVGIVEALKTRGLRSAITVPARQPV